MQKFLIITILSLSFHTLNSFAQIHLSGGQAYGWYVIDPASIPGTPDFSDVYFVSDDEGWVTSSSHAEIYHTTDGGLTFEVQTTQLPCNAIWMLNENEGYAGGQSGFVYRTTNGGTNWDFHGTIGATLTHITFPPTADTGYACGDNGAISSITSSGVTPMNSGIPDNLYSLSFPLNSEKGWVCGGSIILTFTNGIWGGAPNSYPSGGYNAIDMADNQTGWAVGDKIIHTVDGLNWTIQTNPDTLGRAMTDVFFINSYEGWIVGNQGLILSTSTGGTNWILEGTGLTSALLRGVHFTSPTNGYVVGNNKTLLKYGEITSVKNEEELPTELSLSQNYPNPFNPSTKIRFRIPFLGGDERGGFVTLKVYDVLGNEVATLIEEYKQSGNYEVEFNVSLLSGSVSAEGAVPAGRQGYASGVYFYQLKAGEFISTKKMLFIK